MPICGLGSSKTESADPEVRQVERSVTSEARVEARNLEHTMKDLTKAEKMHQKSVKAADKAQHALDKAIANEHKTAKAVNTAQHRHEDAIANERNAEKTLELNKQHEARLREDLEERKRSVDEVRQRKEANDRTREGKLAQVHAARAGSMDLGGGPNATGAAGTGTTNGSALGADAASGADAAPGAQGPTI